MTTVVYLDTNTRNSEETPRMYDDISVCKTKLYVYFPTILSVSWKHIRVLVLTYMCT